MSTASEKLMEEALRLGRLINDNKDELAKRGSKSSSCSRARKQRARILESQRLYEAPKRRTAKS